MELLSEWEYVFIKGNHEELLSKVLAGELDIKILEDKYNISNLVKYITCRQDRMALERVFGCLFTKENSSNPSSMLGNIHKYCCVGQYYQWYIENRIHDDPLIKLWSGR